MYIYILFFPNVCGLEKVEGLLFFSNRLLRVTSQRRFESPIEQRAPPHQVFVVTTQLSVFDQFHPCCQED